jgi:hypothetical protein
VRRRKGRSKVYRAFFFFEASFLAPGVWGDVEGAGLQKEEKVVVVLLFMALGSLAVASWALGDFDSESAPTPGPISIVSEGTVSSIQLTDAGHLILRLMSSTMPIFVSRECGAEDVARRVVKGDRIRARGEIAEYQGRRELSVQRAEDVEVLR